MEETEDKSDDNLILSDLVNDWILEPIVDSVDRQNIVFTLTTKGKEYFKILKELILRLKKMILVNFKPHMVFQILLLVFVIKNMLWLLIVYLTASMNFKYILMMNWNSSLRAF